MNHQEALAQWVADRAHFEARGAIFPQAQAYIPDGVRNDFGFALDSIPALVTDPNSAIPAFLTTMIDPEIFKVRFSPSKGAQIIGEQKKGDWLMKTTAFPLVEHTGEVTSYGDYATSGRAGVNMNWPQRQSYSFQTVKEYGEKELETAGLGKINFVAEVDMAATTVLGKFENLTYFFGVQGLQNYGLLNDPNLSAALTPSTKAAGGVKWVLNGAINATANEIFADIQAMFLLLISQTAGLIDRETKMTLAMSPSSEGALTSTNSFGISVSDLLKKNFPNLTVKTAVQYGALSAANPQGVVAGNLVQLIADVIDGQKTGFCAFTEKMRSHPIVRDLSSFRQKVSAGTWGAVIRQPFAISQMVGV